MNEHMRNERIVWQLVVEASRKLNEVFGTGVEVALEGGGIENGTGAVIGCITSLEGREEPPGEAGAAVGDTPGVGSGVGDEENGVTDDGGPKSMAFF